MTLRRTPLARGSKPLRSGGSPKASKIQRREPKRWAPSSAGKSFDAWSGREVRKRDDSLCRRCGCGWGRMDSAHVFPLRAGSSRYSSLDWRNYPSARVLLCRGCHEAIDLRGEWRWSDIGLDLTALERAAREECKLWSGRWTEKTTSGRPTPRRAA